MTKTIIISDRPFKGCEAEPVAVKEPPKVVTRKRRKSTIAKTPGGGDPTVHKVEGE